MIVHVADEALKIIDVNIFMSLNRFLGLYKMALKFWAHHNAEFDKICSMTQEDTDIYNRVVRRDIHTKNHS